MKTALTIWGICKSSTFGTLHYHSNKVHTSENYGGLANMLGTDENMFHWSELFLTTPPFYRSGCRNTKMAKSLSVVISL